jgi:glycosyltransferase involved in cell wall biosynthesis
MPPRYSVVIPVFNRPSELNELLKSLTEQTFKAFEVIVVDDGSERTSSVVCDQYTSVMSIQYLFKPNSGPGPSRNIGFEKATGDYLVMFDSDCILPPTYFEAVEKFMAARAVDAWGGPDRGHEKFTPLQQAMAYTMSSFWTTGGIRGGTNQADKFQPRSFNMGFSRKVWHVTNGFAFDRLAEDIELSIRMRKEGFKVALIPDAFVYHKRRTNLWRFFNQVQGFGRGRVRVGRVHPGAVKLAHWFPLLFMIGMVKIPFVFLYNSRLGMAGLLALTFYLLLICMGALLTTGSLTVAMLSIPSTLIQLTGYGLGFLKEKLRLR